MQPARSWKMLSILGRRGSSTDRELCRTGAVREEEHLCILLSPISTTATSPPGTGFTPSPPPKTWSKITNLQTIYKRPSFLRFHSKKCLYTGEVLMVPYRGNTVTHEEAQETAQTVVIYYHNHACLLHLRYMSLLSTTKKNINSI